MKYKLEELLNSINLDNIDAYKKNICAFIAEAKKGVNWTEWNQNVFYSYFEQKSNKVANLGNGQMTIKEKSRIKEHWMELAPYLKEIADNPDTPLWDTYKKFRSIVRKYTDVNRYIATNRMIACLQPNVLCSEISLVAVNEILNYISIYTYTPVPDYDMNNWEEASHLLLNIFHTTLPGKPVLDYGCFPWKLLRIFRELSDNGHIPSYWIFPWNPQVFSLHEYLATHDVIDWLQGNYKVQIGDIVYIYCSKPEQKIRYCLQVVKTDIPPEESINDEAYWKEKHSYNDTTFCRLKLLSSIDTDDLCLNKLLENGLNTRPQGKQKINAKLLSYIQTCLAKETETFDPAEIQHEEEIFEGAKKTIIVNQYERNPIARQKCIEANGCKCKVCGMDFEEKYGEIGRGFIHVHHIVPISTIGESYQINPVKDLIPVCPNCHAMLHRNAGEKPLTIDELKKLLK